ncbi:MAG TPA: hypothetical protein VGZ24_03165 [Chthoniobacterales bacterium]|nr:hypothetical protein [Chthoniobacterales bacterium]
MPTFTITLFPYHAALAVHGLDARSPDHVIGAADDVALETLMANQISAVMHHFYQMTFRWRWWGGLTRPSRRPHRHCGCNA